jgi:hypothetical protein
MSPDQTVVGTSGTLILPTRGPDGPGEVMLRMGGGTEAYLAWSEEPLPRGCEVLVYNSRGDRSVDVLQFGSDEDPLT